MAINGEEIDEPATRTLPPVEDAPPETPPASPPLLDSPPLGDQPDSDSRFESTPPTSGKFERHELELLVDSEPTPPLPRPLDQYGTETSVDSGPTSEGNLEPEPMPPPVPEPAFALAPAPGPLLGPTPEPVAFEENEPLPSYAGEASESSLPYPEQEESPPVSGWGTAVNGAVETLENAANVLGDLTDGALFRSASEDEASVGAALVNLFTGGEAGLAPVAEGSVEDAGPSGETGSAPRDDTPQPASPFATLPMGGSSFSLSGVGEVGPGGATPVLLCVLVPVLLLQRRVCGISWVYCDFAKPSSALLLPLERPG